MTCKEKMEKARVMLMLEHPYIGSLVTVLHLRNDETVLTFKSDGVCLTYNEAYMERVPIEEVMFALANGAMHAALRHSERTHRRSGRMWQAATDAVVNSMLVKNGFALPPHVIYDRRFEGMYAEEVYDALQSEQSETQHGEEAEEVLSEETVSEKERKREDDGERIEGERGTVDAFSSSSSISTEEGTAEEQYEQIFQKFRRQGELPAGLDMVIPSLFSHKLHWRELLYRYLAEFAKSSYSFMPPNMKYLYRGICLPSLHSDLLRIVIAVDTSGSVDTLLLAQFLGEVEGIMQSYGNYEIDLLTADLKVRSHQTYLPGERLEYCVSGGGGTDFRPVFDYIDSTIDYPSLLLYFTDGMGCFPDSPPPYDVMWVMPEGKPVPFGDVLLLTR